MLNLAMILDEQARKRPEREAVVGSGLRLSYGQIHQAASRVAAGLAKLGLAPGDKIALGCPNLPWFPIVYYGILKLGGVVVPLNVLLKPREIAYHAALHLHAEDRGVFGSRARAEVVACLR